MIYAEPRLLPVGEAAILVDLADEIDDATNDRVHALSQYLRGRHLPEIVDLIPAYSSLLICYDPLRIDYGALCALLRNALASRRGRAGFEPRYVEIPTTYGGEFGPDLAFVARASGLSQDQIVQLHASVTYQVYFIGFSPGFAYLGSVPREIVAPRLETPREIVPAGSVGIAGRQTGVYPTESPGGWRLIGRTKIDLFVPNRESPALLRPGDRVRFVPSFEKHDPRQ